MKAINDGYLETSKRDIFKHQRGIFENIKEGYLKTSKRDI
jgi:hypothetical protein